ncbi:MAG: helix-turn-helix domain-containing protein, partial [Pseudomonadota bacterium]
SAAMRANPLLGEWRARMVDVTVQAREQQLLTMASRTAEERLMVFLRDFAEAAGPDLQRAGGATALPMSRRDIAEHLGISFETVSRGFTSLKRRGALELIGPGVYRIRDASAAEGVRPRRAALRMTGARGERALDEVDALEDEMYRPQAV